MVLNKKPAHTCFPILELSVQGGNSSPGLVEHKPGLNLHGLQLTWFLFDKTIMALTLPPWTLLEHLVTKAVLDTKVKQSAW